LSKETKSHAQAHKQVRQQFDLTSVECLYPSGSPEPAARLKNTRITAEDIIYALAYANVHRLSIASACQELQDAPSGNACREVLVKLCQIGGSATGR